jgi:hypothetical protein
VGAIVDADAVSDVQDDARTLIVISDLHIGAGALDDFDAFFPVPDHSLTRRC